MIDYVYACWWAWWLQKSPKLYIYIYFGEHFDHINILIFEDLNHIEIIRVDTVEHYCMYVHFLCSYYSYSYLVIEYALHSSNFIEQNDLRL